jgi:hypothetical protein
VAVNHELAKLCVVVGFERVRCLLCALLAAHKVDKWQNTHKTGKVAAKRHVSPHLKQRDREREREERGERRKWKSERERDRQKQNDRRTISVITWWARL